MTHGNEVNHGDYRLPGYMAGYRPLFDAFSPDELIGLEEMADSPALGLWTFGSLAEVLMRDDSVPQPETTTFFTMLDMLGDRRVAEALDIDPDKVERNAHGYPISYRGLIIGRMATIASESENLRYSLPPDTTLKERLVALDERRRRKAAKNHGLDPNTATWPDINAIMDRVDLGLASDASDEVVAETRAARDQALQHEVLKRHQADLAAIEAIPQHLRPRRDPDMWHSL